MPARRHDSHRRSDGTDACRMRQKLHRWRARFSQIYNDRSALAACMAGMMSRYVGDEGRHIQVS